MNKTFINKHVTQNIVLGLLARALVRILALIHCVKRVYNPVSN